MNAGTQQRKKMIWLTENQIDIVVSIMSHEIQTNPDFAPVGAVQAMESLQGARKRVPTGGSKFHRKRKVLHTN